MKESISTKNLVDGYGACPNEVVLSDVGAAITRSRKSLGLTQAELGASLGLGKTQVSKIENSRNMTLSTVEKLYGAMQFDVRLVVEPAVSEESVNDVTEDIVLCVSHFAMRHGISIHSAYSYLKRFGGLNFYLRYYDKKAGESVDSLCDSLDTVTRRNGGGL